MIYKFYYYIAKFFEARKKWELAIKFYLKAQRDNIAIVNYRLGFCYEKRKDFGNAIYFFKKAIALESKKPHWYFHLANAYLGIKKDIEAKKYCKLAIEINPKSNKIKALSKKISSTYYARINLLRLSTDKGIPEEDIFISKITLINKEIVEIHIQGHMKKDYDTTLVSLQCKTRHTHNDEDKSLFDIKSLNIRVDKNGIFDATFEIPSTLLFNTNNSLISIWDFYLLADKKTRLQCFEKFNETMRVSNYDFIPYNTSKKTFSLISVRKSSSISNASLKHIALTISRIDFKTKTAKSVIDLANTLVKQNINVTLIALDLVAMPNHFDINEDINFEYISTPFQRDLQENFNFNQNKILLPDKYTQNLSAYFAALDADVVYMPIFGASFLNPILSSIPKSTQIVLGEYSDRRYTIYSTFIKNDTQPTLEQLVHKTKDKHFFENIDNIDAIHLIKPGFENLFTNISNTPVFTVSVEGIDYPQELTDKLVRFINEKNI